MAKFDDIIEKISKQKTMDAPENIVSRVMIGVEKVESCFLYKLNRFLFQPRELSSDAVSILSGKIMSHRQCSFLLFMVGLLYLIVGLIIITGLRDALSDENINLWLRIQPYVTIASAIIMIGVGFIILYKPQTIIAAKYSIVLHTALIVVNALILEFMLFSPQAIVFALILTTAAMVLGLLLVGAIQNFINFTLLNTGSDCAQNT
jgi:hypothetical protein